MRPYLSVLLLASLGVTAMQVSAANAKGHQNTQNLQPYQWTEELCDNDNDAYFDRSQVSVQNIEDGFKIFARLTSVNLPDYSPSSPAQLR